MRFHGFQKPFCFPLFRFDIDQSITYLDSLSNVSGFSYDKIAFLLLPVIKYLFPPSFELKEYEIFQSLTMVRRKAESEFQESEIGYV